MYKKVLYFLNYLKGSVMAIKMNELVTLTDTAKSTILYYVKEGLLPEPQKPKPNLHLYDESCVEIIRFIKYLQNHFGSSINELKVIMDKGNFSFKNGFETVLETLDVLMGSAHQSTYTAEYLCEQYSITPVKLNDYVEQGLLFRRDGAFTLKELEIVEILLNLESVGVDQALIQEYVKHARQLAVMEVEFAQKILASKEHKNGTVKALFDTTLIFKPYLFNMHTLKAYQESEKQS